MRYFLYLTFAIVFTSEVKSQSISAGDLIIAGYNSRNPDQFSVLTFKNLPAGEVFYITDCGWDESSAAFRAGEGLITYTVPSGGIYAGVVITYPDDPGFSTAGVSGFFGLSTEGDQLYIFRNSFVEPEFIFAFNMNDAGWQNSATDNNSGTLPNTLTSASSITLPEHDNALVNCLLLAAYPDPEDWKNILLQPSSWLLSDHRFLLPPDCNFVSLSLTNPFSSFPEEENETEYVYLENEQWKWNGKNSGIEYCCILNMHGTILHETSFHNTPETLNISELLPEGLNGWYILQTRNQRSVKNFKLYLP